MASLWCSPSSSATSISYRYSVPCHSFQFHNRPLLHMNAFPPSLSSRFSPIAPSIKIKLPFYSNNSFKHRNSNWCGRVIVCCTTSGTKMDLEGSLHSPSDIDCVGTGQDVKCLIESDEEKEKSVEVESLGISIEGLLEWAVLVSPFFFWGTSMVAMKEVNPKFGPFFVSAFRR